MIEFDETIDRSAGPAGSNDSTAHWMNICAQFLKAVSPCQQKQVRELLHGTHNGGAGLRDWVSAIAYRGAVLPEKLPEEIIDVYLSDSEVAALHDCEGCGLAMPVRPSRLFGLEGEPERVYFETCPTCSSRTGPYMYFTRKFQDNFMDTLRRRPR